MIVSSVLVLLYALLERILRALERIDAAHPNVFLHGIAICGALEYMKKLRDLILVQRSKPGESCKKEAPCNPDDKIVIYFEMVALAIAFSMAVTAYFALVAYFSLPRSITRNFVALLKNIYSPLVLLCCISYRTHRTFIWWRNSRPKPKRKPKRVPSELMARATLLYDTYLRWNVARKCTAATV